MNAPFHVPAGAVVEFGAAGPRRPDGPGQPVPALLSAPLAAGSRLPCAGPCHERRRGAGAPASATRCSGITAGPRDEWFETLTPRSARGTFSAERPPGQPPGSSASEGMVTGALQVPERPASSSWPTTRRPAATRWLVAGRESLAVRSVYAPARLRELGGRHEHRARPRGSLTQSRRPCGGGGMALPNPAQAVSGGLLPSLREYAARFGLTLNQLTQRPMFW